jgi:hypothetical protein
MSQKEDLFNLAISNGELVRFLAGQGEYSMQSQFADLPTEYGAAFDPVKSRIKIDPAFGEKVKESIETLAKDPVYGWGAIDYIISLALLKRDEGIDLIGFDLLSKVADALRANKQSFMSLRRWEGKNHADGVWSFVLTSNRILNKKYNITVLPEEL